VSFAFILQKIRDTLVTTRLALRNGRVCIRRFKTADLCSGQVMHSSAHWRLVWGMFLGLAPLLEVSCSRTPSVPRTETAQESPVEEANAWGEELFDYAIENLNQLERFQSKAMLRQIVDRLNQWIGSQAVPSAWNPDPLLATLPKPLSTPRQLQELSVLQFSPDDALVLREAVWLRDVSVWVRGTSVDELSRARNLFDWTVRNIQLSAANQERSRSVWNLPQSPWETLLFGQGTATDRAWVFVLLCRQQGIEAAVLFPAPLVGVLANGRCFLFDPTLGLPVPSMDGITFDRLGRLDIRPATLDEAAGNDRVLRQLDVDISHPYPLKATQLKNLTAMIVASPESLSLRMKLVEARTVSQQRAVFSIDASSHARRWKQVAHISDTQLWPYPFKILRSPSRTERKESQQRLSRLLPFESVLGGELEKARVLHLKGMVAGENGASRIYQNARPSNDDLREDEGRRTQQYLETARKQHPDATPLLLEALSREEAAEDKALVLWAKQAATYWLGLIAYERQSYVDSIDYLQKRTLGAWPNGFWTHGAKYNLARAYEASGQRDKAVEYYREADTDWGAQLRAKWLTLKK